MKRKLLKTFLVAFALVTGSMGVKAQDYSLVQSLTFEDAATLGEGWAIVAGGNTKSQIDHGDGKAFLITADSNGSRDYYYKFTNTSFLEAEKWKIELDFAGSTANSAETLFYLYSSASGNKYGQFTSIEKLFSITDGASYTTTAKVYAGNDNTTSLADISYAKYKTTPSTWYHLTITADKTNGVCLAISEEGTDNVILNSTKVCDYVNPQGMSVRPGKGLGSIAIDNVNFFIVADKPIAPSVTLTGVNKNERTITMSQVQNNDIYYYTTPSDYSIEGLKATKYENPITISEETYFVVYAQSGESISDYTQYHAEAGSVINLNNASVSLNEDYTLYNKVLSNPSFTIIEPNNSSVLLSPSTETLEYSFTPEGGEESGRVTISSGYVFKPSSNGTLKIYASTTGYGKSVYTIPVSAKYTPNFTYNYDEVTAEELPDWSTVSTEWWDGAEAYRSTASSNTTLGRLRFGNNTVTDVVIGWGVGRNSNNCSLKLRNFKLGEINVLDIHTSTDGSDKNALTSKTFFATSGTGEQTNLSSEFFITKLNTVKCLNVYAPVEATDLATVSSVGFATYSPSSNVAVPENVTVYTVTVNDEQTRITLSPVQAGTVLEAGTGYVIEATEGNYPFAVSNEAVSEIGMNDLLVSQGDVTVAAGQRIYVLAVRQSNGSVGFTKVAEGVTIPAGKAYLLLTDNGKEAAPFLTFGNETTAVNGLENNRKANNTYYTLQGMKTTAPDKGLYILNGKKVVVK